jgi:hypothetical protein
VTSKNTHLRRPPQEAPEGEGDQCAAHQATHGAFHCLLWADADELCASQGLAKGIGSSVRRNRARHRHEGCNEAHCPVRDASKEHLDTAASFETLTGHCASKERCSGPTCSERQVSSHLDLHKTLMRAHRPSMQCRAVDGRSGEDSQLDPETGQVACNHPQTVSLCQSIGT